MTAHRRGSSFIRYALPVMIGGKPSDEKGSKGKPRPVTTLKVGEEGGSPSSDVVTTLATGEESGSRGS